MPAAADEATEAISRDLLARRKQRNQIAVDRPSAEETVAGETRSLYLSAHLTRYVRRTRSVTRFILSVMTRDGTIRPAHCIFEWVQQLVIEQCAVLIELDSKLPEWRTTPRSSSSHASSRLQTASACLCSWNLAADPTGGRIPARGASSTI